MTEEEISELAKKLITRFDNTRIIGAGGEWSGSAREGFMFNPKPKSSAAAPVVSGACCFCDGTCAVVAQSVCEAGGGTYQGDGTVCSPGLCPPTGACCIGEDCTIVTEDCCINAGGTYQGDDTTCDPNPCVIDCTSCDDLPPTNPSGPPVHINVTRTLSGTCGNMTFSGSVTYDRGLGFAPVGPVGGHIFCAHNIFTNSFGAFWTGHFTKTCSLDGSHADFGSEGFAGLLGRDQFDCSWWFEMDAFALGIGGGTGLCAGCAGITFTQFFQEITGPGDPSGVYMFTETQSGVTLTTVVTIT